MSGRPRRQSLADAFTPAATGPRDRAATLEGLLPPRRPAAAGQAPARLMSVSPDDVESLAAGGQGRRDDDASSPARAADPVPDAAPEPAEALEAPLDLERVRNVAVYLPVDLLDRLKRTRLSRELTYADLLVEAAAAHLDGLDALFAGTGPSPGASGMPTRSRPRRRIAKPGVQVQIRLDGHQLLWLDEQVQRLRAPSRTAVVVALLQAHVG